MAAASLRADYVNLLNDPAAGVSGGAFSGEWSVPEPASLALLGGALLGSAYCCVAAIVCKEIRRPLGLDACRHLRVLAQADP